MMMRMTITTTIRRLATTVAVLAMATGLLLADDGAKNPLVLSGAPLAVSPSVLSFTELYSFCSQSLCTDGYSPDAALVQGTDGNFYGTTFHGGANGDGTVFKITPAGTLTTLYSFCSQSGCTDGELPTAGLVQGTDGNFYGTTSGGGANGVGTVFKITPAGALTTLHSFCSQSGCTDGDYPSAGLAQGRDGNFYGTTLASGMINGGGTVFKITPTGSFTTLYSFCSQSGCPGGIDTQGVLQGTDGNLYGTTRLGGENGHGTVFKITPAGTLITLYKFCSQDGCPDGDLPTAGLVQGTDGNFYGTTYAGGANGHGTVFKITPAGSLTTLHRFCLACRDGAFPLAGLVQGSDGSFYGTTAYGGVGAYTGHGTVFKITPAGSMTTLYRFCSKIGCPDGDLPVAGLVQGRDGNFYGTTLQGGNGIYDGTVFSLSVGLGAFVETRPTSGTGNRDGKYGDRRD